MDELMQAPDKMVSSMLEDHCRKSVRTRGFVILQPFYGHFDFVKDRRVVE